MSYNNFFVSSSIRGTRYIPWSLEFPPEISNNNLSEYEFLLKNSRRKSWIVMMEEMKDLLYSNLHMISLDYDSRNYVNEDIDLALELHDSYTNQLVNKFTTKQKI